MMIWHCFKMKRKFQYKGAGADVMIECDNNYNRYTSESRTRIRIGPFSPLSSLNIIHPITEEDNGKTFQLSFLRISDHLRQGHWICYKKKINCLNSYFTISFYKWQHLISPQSLKVYFHRVPSNTGYKLLVFYKGEFQYFSLR